MSASSQSSFMFGLRTGAANSLCFLDEQTVVYPGGSSCVCHNFVHRRQRFISASEKSQDIRALALSPSRRYLAVSERAEKASITVFDLHHEQGRKRKPLTAGDMLVQEFLCMAFSPDSKYLIGQTGGPEWMLIFWYWEKNRVLATVKTTTSNNPVTQVSFNPHNNVQLCVTGTGVLKLFRYSEGALKQSSAAKMDSVNFLCHAWTSEQRVIAGTDTGRLLVSECGDLRKEIRMTSAAVEGHADRQVEVKRIKEAFTNEGLAFSRITAILPYSKGFICSTGPGTVCLFEKTQEDSYRMSREILIPLDPCSDVLTPADCQEIDTMSVSPAEETLAISTNQGQLYSISLSSVLTNRVPNTMMKMLQLQVSTTL